MRNRTTRKDAIIIITILQKVMIIQDVTEITSTNHIVLFLIKN